MTFSELVRPKSQRSGDGMMQCGLFWHWQLPYYVTLFLAYRSAFVGWMAAKSGVPLGPTHKKKGAN